MDIKDIKYISTIVEMASFSKASKKLYISQPALSQGIRRIEAELGVTLFVRDRTKVVPTAAALQIAKEGMPLVLKAEEARRFFNRAELLRFFVEDFTSIC